MEIKNSFEVPLTVDDTWATLLDIQKIAPCMPGAELLEVIDPKTYKGKVSVKLGPVALSFVGNATFVEIDEQARQAKVKAQGTDQKGRGGAHGLVAFALSPVDGGTRVDANTTITLSGSVAQYGRATGMIQDVATQIIGQFAASLRGMLERERAANSSVGTAVGETPVSKAAAPAPKAISGFTLIARVLWNRVRRLFSGG